MAEGRVPVLYLAGLGRSGTTLIERTLAETPGVTGLGEVMHLWERGLGRNELCGCGVPFASCPFWREVGARAFGGWERVDAERMTWLKGQVDRASRVPAIATSLSARFAALVEEYVATYTAIYRAVHDMLGGVVVDSSKQVSLAWALRRSPGLDVRVLHCVRDSRGVASSWARDVLRPESVDAEHAAMPRYSAGTVSLLWLLHNVEIEALGRGTPVLRVRYEDFVADPMTTTRAMLDFAGVSAEADHVHESFVELGPLHSCAGNPMRFRRGRIDLVADDRWRTQPASRRRLVTSVTAPLLAHYGYRA
jgi:hypothetical protein